MPGGARIPSLSARHLPISMATVRCHSAVGTGPPVRLDSRSRASRISLSLSRFSSIAFQTDSWICASCPVVSGKSPDRRGPRSPEMGLLVETPRSGSGSTLEMGLLVSDRTSGSVAGSTLEMGPLASDGASGSIAGSTLEMGLLVSDRTSGSVVESTVGGSSAGGKSSDIVSTGGSVPRVSAGGEAGGVSVVTSAVTGAGSPTGTSWVDSGVSVSAGLGPRTGSGSRPERGRGASFILLSRFTAESQERL